MDDLNGDGLVDAWTDSDGDGVVDAVDVDVTGGNDADGDGIDDFADADYIFASDTDGDGINDNCSRLCETYHLSLLLLIYLPKTEPDNIKNSCSFVKAIPQRVDVCTVE